MILSIKTKTKYLEVKEIKEIQERIERIVLSYGLKIKTQFHPKFIEVPNFEELLKKWN